jgi:elongation factor P hydroxylase
MDAAAAAVAVGSKTTEASAPALAAAITTPSAAEYPMATAATTPIVVTADPAKGIKVNAAIIAQPFRDQVKARVQQLKAQGIGTCKIDKKLVGYCLMVQLIPVELSVSRPI